MALDYIFSGNPPKSVPVQTSLGVDIVTSTLYVSKAATGQWIAITGGGGSGTVTQVNTAGIATGGGFTTSGTITVAGSGNTTTAATANANLAGAGSGLVATTDGSGNVQSSGTALSSLAPLASPTFTGTVTTGKSLSTPTTVTFSATPTFDASTSNNFKITLTGNVTSSTLSNATAGQILVFEIIQDGVGSRTFVWPSNVKNGMSITGQAGAANEVSVQIFYYDGTNAYALSPGLVFP